MICIFSECSCQVGTKCYAKKNHSKWPLASTQQYSLRGQSSIDSHIFASDAVFAANHLLIHVSSPLEIRPLPSREHAFGTPHSDVFFSKLSVPTPTKFCSPMGSDPDFQMVTPPSFQMATSPSEWSLGHFFPTNLGWHELHVWGRSLVGKPSVLHWIMFYLMVRLHRRACFDILRPRF